MIKNRIALKLLVFFASALLFFALVSSLTFRQLFTESIKESKRAEMLDRASYLSGMLSQALEGTRSGGAMGGGVGGMAPMHGARPSCLTIYRARGTCLSDELQLRRTSTHSCAWSCLDRRSWPESGQNLTGFGTSTRQRGFSAFLIPPPSRPFIAPPMCLCSLAGPKPLAW